MLEIECIIFDMDGLMFDTERIATIALKEAGKHFGYDIKDKLRLQLLGRSKKDGICILKSALGENFPAKAVLKYTMLVREKYIEMHGLPIKEGLIELVTYAKVKGIKTIVASSSNRDMIEKNLLITNTTPYFDYILGGDEISNSKPDPEIFLKACEICGVDTSKSLVLEDSKSGILAAKNADIKVICIPDLVKHPKEINDLTYKVLKNLKEVLAEIRV